MARWHLLLQLLMICLTAAAAASIAKPGCPEKCGQISIPYPFGIRDGCSIDKQWFNLTCNETYNPPKLYMIGYEVLEISVQQGQARVNTFVASGCYNSSGYMSGFISWMRLAKSGPYTPSQTPATSSLHWGATPWPSYQVPLWIPIRISPVDGRVSFCSDEQRVVAGTCSGIGCCQTSIPAGAKRFNILVGSSYNHSRVLGFNPCSYAFLIADDGFEFNKKDLAINGTYGDGAGPVPVVVDWAIGPRKIRVLTLVRVREAPATIQLMVPGIVAIALGL